MQSIARNNSRHTASFPSLAMARLKQTAKKLTSAPMGAAKSIRRIKTKDAAPTEPRKKRRRRPGNAALAEIRKQQKSTESLLLAAPFKRVVDDLLTGQAWELCARDVETVHNELGHEVTQPCSFAYSGKGVKVADPDSKGSMPSVGEDGAPGALKACRSLDGHGELVPASQIGVRWTTEALAALRHGCQEMLVDTFRDANALNLSKWTQSRAPVTLRPEDMDAAFTLRSPERYTKMNTDKGYFGTAHVRQGRHAVEEQQKLDLKRAKRKALKEDVGEIARTLKRKEALELKKKELAAEKKKKKKKKERKTKADDVAAAATSAAALPQVPASAEESGEDEKPVGSLPPGDGAMESEDSENSDDEYQ